MTVPVEIPGVDFVEDGVTLAFPIPFSFDQPSDIKAYRSLLGVEEQLGYGTGYSVSGSILTLAATVAGATLSIRRESARVQSANYTTTGAFTAESHEEALDRLARVDQEQDVEIARSVRIPRGEGPMELPPLIDRLLGSIAGFHAATGKFVAVTSGALAAYVAPALIALLPTSFKGDPGSAGSGFATRGALATFGNAALPTDDAVLAEPGREGAFVWDASDLSDAVAADPSQGLFVAKASDPTGASGAWRRVHDGKLDVKWFGAVGNGVADDTAALIAAFATAAFLNAAVQVPEGDFKITANVTVPFNALGYFVPIRGVGRWSSRLLFHGAGVDKGLYWNGVAIYGAAPQVVDLGIEGRNNAKRGITMRSTTDAVMRDLQLWGFKGAGIRLEGVLVPRIDHVRVWFSGSATEAEVEIDHAGPRLPSTTVAITDLYCAGGQPNCLGGLKVDRTSGLTIAAVAIESCGAGVLIGTETENAYGVSNINITGANIERCTPYMRLGTGWTGAAGQAVKSGNIQFSASPSQDPLAPIEIPVGVELANCSGIRFRAVFGGDVSVGLPEADYDFLGTGNIACSIDASYSMFGTGYPYVRVDGVMRTDASPYYEFILDITNAWGKSGVLAAVGANTAVNLSISAPQGGLRKTYYLGCAGGTTIATFTGGNPEMRALIVPTDSNGTLKHGALGANGVLVKGGADMPLVTGEPFELFYDNVQGKWRAWPV